MGDRVMQFWTIPSEEQEKEERHFGLLVTFWLGTFATLFRTTWRHKTLEDEWYVVIKDIVFEILRDFHQPAMCEAYAGWS